MDSKGNWAIKPQFKHAGDFHDGLDWVMVARYFHYAKTISYRTYNGFPSHLHGVPLVITISSFIY
ncbi:WG repeat-containing protein [Cohnella panacarvi]|uniref:WG repeat-containing protein n=1 Tax=Cohnella panacarvi TaxID=400776 RepID=UPI003CCC107C